MNTLDTAELAIYALLSIPVIYIFVTHLTAGILGWFYLFAFCSIRVVGAALSTSTSNSSSASIISNIGLSPLLLAVFGVIHEGRVYKIGDELRPKLEWTVVLVFHVFVTSGVGLVAAGASALTRSTTTDQSGNNLRLIQVGLAILTACWIMSVAWLAMTLLQRQHRRRGHREILPARCSHGLTLLRFTALALVFVGIRVLYSLVAFVTQDPNLNPVTGSLTVRVVLSFLPELIATLLLITAGIITRRRSKTGKLTSGTRAPTYA